MKTVFDTSQQYTPSTIVMKLAEKVGGKPIAESIRSDGTVVVVFEDGRKIVFDKDAITRTLTEQKISTPETAMGDPKPEGEGTVSEKPRRRKQKGQDGQI
jgi:glucan-binding YG repeat protein